MDNFNIHYSRISWEKKFNLADASEYSTLELLIWFERDFSLLSNKHL